MQILPVGRLINRRRTFSQGTTLIEMLVIMTVFGILLKFVGYLVFKYTETEEDAQVVKKNTAVAQLRQFEMALDHHRLDTSRYPETLEGLRKNTGNSPKWSGPYIKNGVPKDSWGNEYQYKKPGRDGRDYDLYSFGADGQEGGEGENADITSWQTSK